MDALTAVTNPNEVTGEKKKNPSTKKIWIWIRHVRRRKGTVFKEFIRVVPAREVVRGGVTMDALTAVTNPNEVTGRRKIRARKTFGFDPDMTANGGGRIQSERIDRNRYQPGR